MDFKSRYFETAEDLVRAKDNAWDGVKTRRKRLDEALAVFAQGRHLGLK